MDEFNPASASRRRKAAERFAEVAGDPSTAGEFDRQFLKAFDDATAAAVTPADFVDVSKIVRPDLFITPEVIGLSVPCSVLIDRKPA